MCIGDFKLLTGGSAFRTSRPEAVVHWEGNPFWYLDVEVFETVGSWLDRGDHASMRATSVSCYLTCQGAAGWRSGYVHKRGECETYYREARLLWMSAHMWLWVMRGVAAQARWVDKTVEGAGAVDGMTSALMWYPTEFRQELVRAGRMADMSGFLNSQKHWPPQFGREVRASLGVYVNASFFFSTERKTA